MAVFLRSVIDGAFFLCRFGQKGAVTTSRFCFLFLKSKGFVKNRGFYAGCSGFFVGIVQTSIG
jgi:hypothetical protein